MAGIECKIVDSKLFSGSSDLFRTANGGYWYEATVDDGTEVAFETTTMTSPHSRFFDRIFLSGGQSTIDRNSLMPSHRIAVRTVSDGTGIKTDDEWKTIWLGGDYGPRSYTTIYTEDQFEYTNFNYAKPYDQLQATLLTTAYDPSAIQISYDYRNYLMEYENYQNSQTNMSELLLPNYYIMADMTRWDLEASEEPLDLYPPEMLEYLSRHDNTAFSLNQFLEPDPAKLPEVPDWSVRTDLAVKNNRLAIEYLTSSYVQHSLSASAQSWATTKMKNMLFDADAVKRVRADSEYMPSLSDRLPYNMKINFTTEDSDTFTKAIVDNEYDSEFIKSIYQIFSDKSENIQTAQKDYNKSSMYYTASVSDGSVGHVAAIESTTYREVDYLQMLVNSHNTYTDTDEDYMFVGPRNIQREAASTDSKEYRYVKTQPPLALIGNLLDYIRENPDETTVTMWADLYSDMLRHTETVAYRVEKIGGPASGDSNTQSALQNYWFINSRPDPDSDPRDAMPFNFIDSQVKYDQEYTYKVYAYILTVGIRYNFTDLVLSRQIGCENEDADKEGLEFYDPLTGERMNRLLLDDTTTYPTSFSSLEGTFLTEANVFSTYPYAADFYLNYEPQVKIIEVPLYAKTLKILDNPVNEPVITPYGIDSSANEIGFQIIHGTYASRPYPTPVTDADSTYKDDYLHANDLSISMDIPNASVTNATEILIYRSTVRPQSISDMQYSAYDTIDLRMPQQKYSTFGSATYNDKVAPNKKYYYLFKSVNEHDTQAHLSPVYEAQVVNDGGYAYAIFNTILESELEEKVYTNPTKHFKNLIQLQPNLSQMQLNTDDADFSNSAASEMDNISIGSAADSIWDKTFKIRLTSKKTGKKIDFNITYNLRSE